MPASPAPSPPLLSVEADIPSALLVVPSQLPYTDQTLTESNTSGACEPASSASENFLNAPQTDASSVPVPLSTLSTSLALAQVSLPSAIAVRKPDLTVQPAAASSVFLEPEPAMLSGTMADCFSVSSITVQPDLSLLHDKTPPFSNALTAQSVTEYTECAPALRLAPTSVDHGQRSSLHASHANLTSLSSAVDNATEIDIVVLKTPTRIDARETIVRDISDRDIAHRILAVATRDSNMMTFEEGLSEAYFETSSRVDNRIVEEDIGATSTSPKTGVKSAGNYSSHVATPSISQDGMEHLVETSAFLEPSGAVQPLEPFVTTSQVDALLPSPPSEDISMSILAVPSSPLAASQENTVSQPAYHMSRS